MGQGIFILILVIIEWYFFRSVKYLINHYPFLQNKKNIVFTIYWMIAFLAIGGILFYMFYPKIARRWNTDYPNITFVLGFCFLVLISKFIGSIFFLIDDIKTLFVSIANLVSRTLREDSKNLTESRHLISRTHFLQWLGFGISTLIISTLTWGLFNKYRYRIHKKRIKISGLPKAFEGLKIVQISDIHSGSLKDIPSVERGVKKMLDLKPDIIFFTGDLVNNLASEVVDLIPTLSKIKAPLGVYSILGNHDYGDYARWDSIEAKKKNLDTLKQYHADIGWNLLLNDSAIIDKNGEKIGILGVENWSSFGRFAKYGDLEKTYNSCKGCDVKILLSHDPSHWKKEVVNKKQDIALSLSGHTHGMQYGVEIPGFKWSPVQYAYKEWAGLYSKKHQHLYVNRGFGFIGYPGRFGILPEITLLELRRTNKNEYKGKQNITL